jgi:fructosamine-3-kinase
MQNIPEEHLLAQEPFRSLIERAVSAHTSKPWRVQSLRDMHDFACHPSAILSGPHYSVFAKFSGASDDFKQFEAELSGLKRLQDLAGVLIPEPVGILTAQNGSLLVMQSVPEIERGPQQWREIGETLARIHRVKGESFGWETNGYFGPLPQNNMQACDWPAFYATRRLIPGLKLAMDSGNLPVDTALRVEKLIERLPDLCGPEVTPTLLHGDSQKNNYISSAIGAYVIDPAVYYGHPEMDLAYVDYFEPVPQEVFDAYREELPIDSGFERRRSLWRMWGYLAAVTVEGAGYLPRLEAALKEYV